MKKATAIELLTALFIGLVLGSLLTQITGCSQTISHQPTVKTEYGPWLKSRATVLEHSVLINKEQKGTLIHVDKLGQKIYISCQECKVGDTLEIQYRKVFVTFCNDQRCTFDESYEINPLFVFPPPPENW